MSSKNKISSAVAAGALALASATAMAVPIQWTVGSGGNDHWYEYRQGAFGWHQSMALAPTHVAPAPGLLPGYLATITSQAERDFIYGSVTVNGIWVSGSDEGNEGVWSWRAGPEAGQVFWNGGVTVTYASWAGGEPNNLGGEHYLYAHWSERHWNDYSPGGNDCCAGYLVEWSAAPNATPEPGTLALIGLSIAGLGLSRSRRK